MRESKLFCPTIKNREDGGLETVEYLRDGRNTDSFHRVFECIFGDTKHLFITMGILYIYTHLEKTSRILIGSLN